MKLQSVVAKSANSVTALKLTLWVCKRTVGDTNKAFESWVLWTTFQQPRNCIPTRNTDIRKTGMASSSAFQHTLINYW